MKPINHSNMQINDFHIDSENSEKNYKNKAPPFIVL
jgi:hypothetical protein